MRFMKAIIEVFLDSLYSIAYFLKSNLRTFANLLNLICPYLMYIFGFNSSEIGPEIFVPLGIMFIVYILRSLANKLGTGNQVPTPVKRFTKVDEDGEVSVENSRVPELILYLADLEDYFERKGYL